ncbi:glycosyltransferase family 2 protein [Streptomyces sp. NBC_01485]|uniref:glycosyltransferase family 2 protein n=1 Tax=Streptomyces sp. NBC_01485 TaxID=2903884 RepID=UPI002E35FA65|nr:glycosyltransferase family 2 protein [Streptomyces sp. NBC_01485]
MPARNEEIGVLTSLESLAAQSRRPDLIVVVVNNSTDRTDEYARRFAEDENAPPTVVLNFDDNPHKKAGALNYGLRWLREAVGGRLTDRVGHILVMDADTELHSRFVERAQNVLASDPELGGVSAACLGRTDLWRNPWQRFLLGMQIIEYGRAANARYRTDVHTMSGAGSFYRAEALQNLIDWRGEVFWEDHRNLVEDYETTLALKESGWKVTANQLCIAYTDLMPTLRELIQQRERWSRGTVDTLRRRGWTKFTWHTIATMILGCMGFVYIPGWGSGQLLMVAQHGLPRKPLVVGALRVLDRLSRAPGHQPRLEGDARRGPADPRARLHRGAGVLALLVHRQVVCDPRVRLEVGPAGGSWDQVLDQVQEVSRGKIGEKR